MIFCHILRRKHRIIQRLEGIGNKLMLEHNKRLVELRKHLWEEYNQLIQQEETYWYQMARRKWVSLGDKNTRFFHQAALTRQRCNCVTV